ncbi:MAG: hypothetical protein LBT00_14645 [Spirochaetaceae bacterium]|nr:hypothetical protein [Spirochaetaceae bacterium]
MDRTDEVIYLAGLPGVPRMILWVKISTCRGGPWAGCGMNAPRPPFWGRTPLDWIASPFGFAMTMPPVIAPVTHQSLRA